MENEMENSRVERVDQSEDRPSVPGRGGEEKSCESRQISPDDATPSILIHGLNHVLHLICEDTVCHMTCGEGAAGFASLHSSGHVQFYDSDGHLRDPSLCPSLTIPYAGLTSTHLPGRLVGWGPGAILTLLDAELKPLVRAVEPMDVRVCKVLEHSDELVTAGMGNVCVWCVTHMACRVRVVEGLERHMVFTHLALVPSRAQQGPRALVVYGRAVVVVDLSNGCIVEHKKNLHLREITGLIYCPVRHIVVTASDATIRVWAPDWELQMAFVGHTALVTSLALCPVSGFLLSSSLDGTLRCWSLDIEDQIQIVSIPSGYTPPLAIGGLDSSGTFFSYTTNSVDFWTFSCLYSLHCKLGGALEGSVRQISAPPRPPSLPACVLCIHGNSNVTIVAVETCAVLTRYQAQGRVRCADYCVPKEILLVLTEDGVVTVTSTLTNPVTVLAEWHAMEQWDWPGGQVEAKTGKACCMVLYSNITDTQSAQEQWRSLQMQRPQKPKRIKLLHDAKNRFLVIVGHHGGCVSVLTLHSGKIQYRTSAHNQDITSMQAYTDSGFLLTAGEDKTVLVWKVQPDALQCLSLYFSVSCDLPPLLLALMGTQLTVALKEPENSLVQYNLHSQSRLDHPLEEDHHSKITGLCACHHLSVFASSSLDGTVRIWNGENRLLRVLELNAEPECLAYCEESGDLLIGISGDLYKIPCRHLLPHDCSLRKCDPHSDLPTSWTPTKSQKCRAENYSVDKDGSPEKLERINDAVFGKMKARHKDLESLQKGEIECRKRNPATTQTRKEAFNSYVQLMYSQPPEIKISEEDMFDVYAELFPPKLPELPPLTPPSITEGFFPNKNLLSPNKQASLGFIPNSVLVGQLWPDVKVKNPTKRWKLRNDLGQVRQDSKPDKVHKEQEEEEEEPDMQSFTPILETLPNKENPPTPPPVIRKIIHPYRPPKPLPPIKRPSPPLLKPPPTPPAPAPPQQPTPLPPSPPSPQLPEFLVQFTDEQWFQRMFPDLNNISDSLSPKEFCVQLLNFMISWGMDQKLRVLKALFILIKQEVLDEVESLRKGLLACLQNCIHINMSEEEQHLAGELLNLLVHLSPDSSDTIVELLAILADKDLDLQGSVLCVLQRMGVEEAELWLCPELEPWISLTKDQTNQHQSLKVMASHWLSSWTRKYKVHNRTVFLHSGGKKSGISPVKVLQYFCSVQRSKQAQPPPPESRRDSALVSSALPRLKPIQRLRETYRMSRRQEPRGLLLPPYRPLLMGFTRFLSLPIAHVTLSPFPLSLDFRYFENTSPQRYFFLERSYVQYYR